MIHPLIFVRCTLVALQVARCLHTIHFDPGLFLRTRFTASYVTMLKRYSFWLWVAVIVQLLTAGLHSVSLFASPPPLNDTERQLYDLMSTYRKDFGAGFARSTRRAFDGAQLLLQPALSARWIDQWILVT